jgi:3-phenylpropionate/trans-cinnamate dioxygenase ferredoxin component
VTKCRIASVGELMPGELRRIEVEGTAICLARVDDGTYYAVEDRCSHESIELSDGDLQGMEIECPAHGSRFNVATGDVEGLPAFEPVKAYQVEVKGDDVLVEL